MSTRKHRVAERVQQETAVWNQGQAPAAGERLMMTQHWLTLLCDLVLLQDAGIYRRYACHLLHDFRKRNGTWFHTRQSRNGTLAWLC